MNKQNLKLVVEKAKTQTKNQAMRMVDRLSGVRIEPLALKELVKRKQQNRLFPQSEKEIEGKAKGC